MTYNVTKWKPKTAVHLVEWDLNSAKTAGVKPRLYWIDGESASSDELTGRSLIIDDSDVVIANVVDGVDVTASYDNPETSEVHQMVIEAARFFELFEPVKTAMQMNVCTRESIRQQYSGFDVEGKIEEQPNGDIHIKLPTGQVKEVFHKVGENEYLCDGSAVSGYPAPWSV
jgi:hypothetical protein